MAEKRKASDEATAAATQKARDMEICQSLGLPPDRRDEIMAQIEGGKPLDEITTETLGDRLKDPNAPGIGIKPPRQSGALTDEAADVAARVARGEQPALDGGLDRLLRELSAGRDVPAGMDMRKIASGFAAFEGAPRAFFVNSDRGEGRAKATGGVTVDFQSVSRSEIWWGSDGRHGVAKRSMKRTVVKGTHKGKRHGYFGYQYTLVVFNGTGEPASDPCAEVSMVQVWPEAEEAPKKRGPPPKKKKVA